MRKREELLKEATFRAAMAGVIASAMLFAGIVVAIM